MENNKIRVKNRSSASVSYVIPDLGNYRRKFEANETKILPLEEIQKLAYTPGGDYLLQHYLVIEDVEARTKILGNVELEYDYTKEDIKRLLESGSLDQLLDCLDFAPDGVIELVKKVAVEIELNDVRKRHAIHSKTGFNVDSAIMINKETEETEEKKTQQRRVTAAEDLPAEGETPARRYTANKK